MNILRECQAIVMLFLAAVAAIFLIAPERVDAAESQQKGGFIELGFGQYQDQTNTISTANESKISRIYGGHQFSDYFGVEIGYVDFAKANFNTSGTTLQYEAHGLHAKAIFSLPFSRDPQGYSAVFISGGAWRWDIEASELTARARTHGIGPTAGVGLIFASKSTALKLEYERFIASPKVNSTVFVSDVVDDKTKQDAITVNLMFLL